MKTVTPAKNLMTAEEFAAYAALPENDNRWLELVRGEVIELPVPKKAHGFVCGRVTGHLFIYKQKVGWGGLTSNDAGVILERDPDTVRGPDVAFYEEEDDEQGYSQVAPLLAVEVLSPDDKANQVVRKIADFLAHKVQLVWIINPADRTVTVYQPNKVPRILNEDEEITGGNVLPGFRCKVADFFPKPKTASNGKKKPKKQT